MVKTADNTDSHWLLFLMVPFFAGIAAIKRFRAPWAKNIIWAFVIFYGATYALGKESGEDDINRYVEQLRELYGKSLSFDQSVKLFKESGEADILRTFLAISISRFTDSKEVLTGVYGLIFGFFFSRNVWYVLDRTKGKIKPFTFILIAVFILINPFWNINGFRFNTAMHIFFYGLIPYLYTGKRKTLPICALSILVHFTFLFPLAILGLYFILGNRLKLYFGIFIISVFVSEININSFNSFLEAYVPESFVERTEKYRNEEYVETARADNVQQGQAQKVWYAAFYIKGLYWALKALLVLLFFSERKTIRQKKGLYNLLCFTFLFFGIANMVVSLPSAGRFIAIATSCTTALLIFHVQNEVSFRKYLNQSLLIASPALLLFIIVSIRTGFYSFSVTALIGNPIFIFFTNYNISLNDLIK
jgi:hypothetical protein